MVTWYLIALLLLEQDSILLRQETDGGVVTVNWLSNIRMAYKILCLVFVAAIGLAAVSFTGFSSLRATEQTVDELSSVYLPAKQYLADNQLNMRKIQSGMLEAIATPQPDRRVKMKKDLEDKYTPDFLAAWNSYKELAGQMNGGAGIDAVEQAWNEYRSTAQQVIALTIAGQHEAASTLYAGEGIRKLNALKNSLNDLQEACDAEVSRAQAANAAESAATNRRMVVISLIAFVLLVLSAVYIIREITDALSKMIGVCRELKEGDFSDHSDSMERGDEFGEMWAALLAVRTNLRRLMGKFSETSEQLAAASEQLTASSQQSADASGQVAQSVTDAAGAATQQQDSVDRSNQAVAEVSASVHEIESTSVRVAAHAQQASKRAQAGTDAVETAVCQMRDVESTVQSSAAIVDKLGQRSKEIGQIVDTISEISDQTNLLALNAAIEAARAGEAGRGFAVVADEVRKLAEQSQEAAQRIAALIQGIRQDTDEAVSSMQAGRDKVVAGAGSVSALKENFSEIVGLIEGIAGEIQGISESMRGVTGDTEQITSAVARLSQSSQRISDEMQTVSAATEEQTASAQDIARASESLSNLAQELQNAIRVFKLS